MPVKTPNYGCSYVPVLFHLELDSIPVPFWFHFIGNWVLRFHSSSIRWELGFRQDIPNCNNYMLREEILAYIRLAVQDAKTITATSHTAINTREEHLHTFAGVQLHLGKNLNYI